MRFAAHLALAVIALALSAAPASAEVKTFRDWLAACDNGRNCTAYGLREYAAGAFLRVDRDGAPDAAARFTVLVDAQEGTKIALAFDDPALGGLPKEPVTARTGDELTRIAISAEAAEPFLAALRKAGKLIVSRAEVKPGEDRVIGEISLSGALAALLWIDEQQKRLDTVTALIRRGAKPASAVPAPPALPVVHAAKPGPAPDGKTFPQAILAKGRTICGADDPNPEPGDINALGGNLVAYWFECRAMSGAYNAWSGLVIAPRDKPAAGRVVQLPYPPGETAVTGIEKRLIVNAGFDPKTLTLSMFAKSRGPGDCGSSGAWVFDGTAFRLARYQAMPVCAGLVADEWPVIYRVEVK
jgi:hypothetical protein